MPYKSEAQRKYFNANREKLEAEGVDVDEWNESSKGKKLPEKVKDSEKQAFVRQLVAYLLKKKNKEPNSTKPGVAPMNEQKTESAHLAEKAASLLANMSKKAGIVDHVPELLGSLGGGLIGGLKTPEVTGSNNPIINRIRGDVYPKENARMQNILRGAATGLTGVIGGRAGYTIGDLLSKTPVVANRFVSPGVQKLIQQILPKITMVGGAGAGGASGLAGYDLLKNISERSKDLGKAEKKGYVQQGRGIDMSNRLPGKSVNEAIAAQNQPNLSDRYRQANRDVNVLGHAALGGGAGATLGAGLGVLAQALLPKALRGNFSREAIAKTLGVAGGTLGAGVGGMLGIRSNNTNPYLKNPTQLKLGYVLSPAEKRAFIEMVKVARCWKGYEPVPGKKAYSDGSCRPVGSGDKKKTEKKAFNQTILQAGRGMLNQGGNMLARGIGNMASGGMRMAGQLGSSAMQAAAPVAQAGFNMGRQALNRIPGNAMLGAGVGAAGMAAMPSIARGINNAGQAIGQGVLDAGQMAQRGMNTVYNTGMAPFRALNRAGENLGQGVFDAYQGGKNMANQGMNMIYNTGMAPFRALNRAGENLGQGAFDAYQGGKNLANQGMNMIYNTGMAPFRALNRAGENLGQGAFDAYQGGKNMLGQGLQSSGQLLSSAGRYLQNP